MLISCPTCQRQIDGVADDFPHRPFCSGRCKTIDLGRWLDESYRISTPVPDVLLADEPFEPGEVG
ncbi:MAG: DNA gyrase inhibitor YacG [Nannocystaceae bacterium]